MIMQIYLFFLIIFLIIFNYLNKKNFFIEEQPETFYDLNGLLNIHNHSSKDISKKEKMLFLKNLKKINENIILSDKQKSDLTKISVKYDLENYLISNLSSFFKYKRIVSANYLGVIKSKKSRMELELALKKEKNFQVKIYILNSLYLINDERSIPLMIDSLVNSPKWYRRKAFVIISMFEEKLLNILEYYKTKPNMEIQSFIIYFASKYPDKNLKYYLLIKSKTADPKQKIDAVKSLAELYPEELLVDEFLYNRIPEIRNISIKLFKKMELCSEKNLFKIAPFLSDKYSKEPARETLIYFLKKKKNLFEPMMKLFEESDPTIKKQIGVLIVEENNILHQKMHNNKIEKEKFYALISDHEIYKEFIKRVDQDPLKKKFYREFLDEKEINISEKIEKQNSIISKEKKILYIFIASLIFFSIYIVHIFIYNNFSILEVSNFFVRNILYTFFVFTIFSNLLYFFIYKRFKQKVKNNLKVEESKNIEMIYSKNFMPSMSLIYNIKQLDKDNFEKIKNNSNLDYSDYNLIIFFEKKDGSFSEELYSADFSEIYKSYDYKNIIFIEKTKYNFNQIINYVIQNYFLQYLIFVSIDIIFEEESLKKIGNHILDNEIKFQIFKINSINLENTFKDLKGNIVSSLFKNRIYEQDLLAFPKKYFRKVKYYDVFNYYDYREIYNCVLNSIKNFKIDLKNSVFLNYNLIKKIKTEDKNRINFFGDNLKKESIKLILLKLKNIFIISGFFSMIMVFFIGNINTYIYFFMILNMFFLRTLNIYEINGFKNIKEELKKVFNKK